MTKRWKPSVRDSRKRQTHPDTGQTTQTKVRTETDSQDSLQKGKILTYTTDRKGESKTKEREINREGAVIEFKAMFTFG